MGHATIIPSPDEFEVARNGARLQAEAAGLNLEDPGVQAFLENQAQVVAFLRAEARQLQNMLHEGMTHE